MNLDEYLENFKKYRLDLYKKSILLNEEERNIYIKSQLQKTYNNILKEEANLIKKLVKENNIEKYLSVYNYLLFNGYFSYNNKFIYLQTKKEIDQNLALNINAGNGCCRNISLHFDNIINKILEEKRFILIGSRYENINQINKNSYKLTHVESFDNKHNKIYDALNFKIQSLNFDYIDDKYYTGVFDLGLESIFGLDENSKQKLNNLSKRFDKSKLLTVVKKETKTKKELIDLKNIGIKICQDNKKILKEHQEKLKEEYNYVYKKLK